MSENPISEPRLAAAIDAYHAGRTDEARRVCEQVLALEPGDGDARMWLGLIAMQARRWDEAITALDGALQVRVDPWTLANLGNCYATIGRLADAEYCLAGARQVQPDLVEARVGLATVLHGLRRFDAALAELDAAARIEPGASRIALRRGCTLVELGRYDEAQEAFDVAALDPRARYAGLVAFDRAAYDAIARTGPVVTTPSVALAAPHAGDMRGVVLISADPVYARKYGFASLRSFAAHADSRLLMHVHVYDPDADIVAEISSVARAAGLARVAITTEACGAGEPDSARRRAYYTCGRLLHLPAWLEQYRAPILCMDADMIVEAPLEALFSAQGALDARLNLRHSIHSPWLDIVANVMVAYPTPGARRFFNAVGNYMLRYLGRGNDPWGIDQVALFCVFRMMCRFGEPPRIDWMKEAHRMGLWHLGHGYDYLLDDPRFRRYSGPP